MELSFAAARGAGRDKPGDAGAVGMGDGEEEGIGHATDGVFPSLDGMAGIDRGEPGGIGEDEGGPRKIHPLFGVVDSGLGGIPRELHG